MKIKRILQGFLCLVLFTICIPKLSAQVTFGSLEKPESGALLQLKNIDDIDDGSANATKGMMLPRVELEHIAQLYPMFGVGYVKANHDLEHTGLMVYNLNENLPDGDGAGIYIWDGEKWESIGLVKRTISAGKSKVYLSEVNTSETISLNVVPEDLEWEMIGVTTLASSDPGCDIDEPNNTLTFTRDPNAPCGNKRYTFGLCNSTKTVDIDVAHIGLELNKTLFKVGEDGTSSLSTTVLPEGGDADWVVVSYSSDSLVWTKPPTNEEGKLSFEIGTALYDGYAGDSIVVAHVNEPKLQRVIKIVQNKEFIMLPVFDYLVVKYKYSRAEGEGVARVDLDTATEFTNTGVPAVDAITAALGWALPGYLTHNGEQYFIWGGDNTQTGYETVYANMTFMKDKILPADGNREINVDMYGTWYYIHDTDYANNRDITINITLYRGGKMEKGDQNDIKTKYDFFNVPDDNGLEGEEVFSLDKDGLEVKARYAGRDFAKAFRTYFTHVLTLEYDKEENNGVLVLPSSRSTDSFAAREALSPLDPNYPKPLPGEDKEVYLERAKEYEKQRAVKH